MISLIEKITQKLFDFSIFYLAISKILILLILDQIEEKSILLFS
jgi:hypothetical protein